MHLPMTSAPDPAERTIHLRVVHRRGQPADHARPLPHDMRNPRLSRYELDYLNWYHGDPLRRSHRRAAEHTINNGEELLASNRCGCFSCGSTFPPMRIHTWLRDSRDRTALCPECDADAVIGDASGYPLTPEFLAAMRDAWC